jgi:DNA-directed RNA polymerase subunit RPC12/RpoP
MSDESSIPCSRCGVLVATVAAMVNHDLSDPLRVVECPDCGSILDIGGHPW